MINAQPDANRFRILIKLKVKVQLGQEAAGTGLQKYVCGVVTTTNRSVMESAAGVETFENAVDSVGVVMGAVGRESSAPSVGTSKRALCQ